MKNLKMKIGYVQNNPLFNKKKTNIKKIEELLDGIKADLIVLPELFATGYTFISKKEVQDMSEDKSGETAIFLKNIAKKTGAIIVGGFIEKSIEKNEKNEKLYYNSSMIVSKSKVIGIYRKIHLFNKEKLWFSPGNRNFNVYDIEINGIKIKIGLMICFDWIFPESARSLALKGADIIAHSANLVLPYCQKAMFTRCLENRVFAITANRIGTEKRGEDEFTFTGGSQITSIDGSSLSSAPSNSVFVDFVEIDPELARNKQLNEYNNLFLDQKNCRKYYEI